MGRGNEGTEPRDQWLRVRLTKTEVNLLAQLQKKRKLINSKRCSQAKIIVDALRFANGEIIF